MMSPEYAQRVFTPVGDWFERRERLPSDYGEMNPNTYEGFKSKEEEDNYWEEISKQEIVIF